MLDGVLREALDPHLDRAGGRLHRAGVGANTMTFAGLALGLAAAGVTAAGGVLWLAVVAFLLSRVADGLDGAIARHAGRTDFGGYLDITADFIVYAVVPLAMVLRDPAANALAGAVLLAVFYINGTTFLAFAVMAERRGMTTRIRGEKSLYFTAGLTEGSETILLFTLFLIWPGAFVPLALIFAALCLITAVSRVALTWRVFGR